MDTINGTTPCAQPLTSEVVDSLRRQVLKRQLPDKIRAIKKIKKENNQLWFNDQQNGRWIYPRATIPQIVVTPPPPQSFSSYREEIGTGVVRSTSKKSPKIKSNRANFERFSPSSHYEPMRAVTISDVPYVPFPSESGHISQDAFDYIAQENISVIKEITRNFRIPYETSISNKPQEDTAWFKLYEENRHRDYTHRDVCSPPSPPHKKERLPSIKLGNRRYYNRKRYVVDRERINNLYFFRFLPFYDDYSFEEQMGFEYNVFDNPIDLPKFPSGTYVKTTALDNLYNTMSQSDIVQLMDDSELFLLVCKSFDYKHQTQLINYLVKLYKYSDYKTLISAMIQFYTVKLDTSRNVLKSVFRKNKTMLDMLEKDLDNFANRRSPGTYQEQIFGLYKDMSNLVSSTSSQVDVISSKIIESLNKVDEVSTNLKHTTNNLNGATKTTNTVISNFKHNAVIIISHFINLFVETSFPKWSLSLTTILSVLGLGEYAFHKMNELFNTFNQQVSSNNIKFMALISSFLGDYSPVKLLGSSAFSTMREVKAVTELVELLEGLAKEWGILDSPEVELANIIKVDVAKLIDDYAKFQALHIVSPSKYLFSKTYDEFLKSRTRVVEIEKEFLAKRIKGLEGTTIIAEVAKLRDNYQKLYDAITAIRRGSNIRQEPVAVCFLGASGIGKSKMVLNMVSNSPTQNSMLAKRYESRKFQDKPEWQDNDVRTWQCWNESLSNGGTFSDGYVGQDIHVVDDIFQSSDDMEHVKWINYVSPAQYLTNQAALENKGLPYTAKLALTSCNKFPKTSSTIKEIRALARRFIIVDTTAVGPVPSVTDDFDPTFKHLQFNVYNSGLDKFDLCPNPQPPKQMSYIQLCDFILDRILNKYKTFCQEAGLDYSEQVSDTTFEEISQLQFRYQARHKSQINNGNYFKDNCWTSPLCAIDEVYFDYVWTTYTDEDGNVHYSHSAHKETFLKPGGYLFKRKPFHMIQFSHEFATSRNLHSRALKEIVSQNPEFLNVDYVMSLVRFWAPHSAMALKEFANSRVMYVNPDPFKESYQFITKDLIQYFKVEDNSTWEDDPFAEDPQDATDEEDLDPQSWFDYIWDKIYNIFEETTFDVIYNKIISVLASCWKSLTLAFSTIKDFLSKQVDSFMKLSPIQSIILYLTPFKDALNKDFSSIVGLLLNPIISLTIGSALLVIFERFMRFLNNDRRCLDCVNENTEENIQIVDHIHNVYCKRNCNLGLIYSTHTPICLNLKEQFKILVANMCSCRGDCEDSCDHASRYDPRIYTTMADIIKPHNHSLASQLYELEGSDESRTSKKKSKFQTEGSDESLKIKKKSGFKIEGSDESLKIKKKSGFKLEGQKLENVRNKNRNSYSFEGTPLSEEIFNDDQVNYDEQIQIDPKAYDVSSTISKIMTSAWAQKGMTKYPLNGIGYGPYVITPYHLKNIDGKYYANDAAGKQQELTLISCNVKADRALWRMDKHACLFSRMLDTHLITKQDLLTRVQDNTGCMLVVPRDNRMHIIHSRMLYHKVEKIAVKTDFKDYENVLQLKGLYHSGVGTKDGDCGSPLIMINPNCGRKVVGYHILGSRVGAYSASLTVEDLDEMIKKDTYEEQIYTSVLGTKSDCLLDPSPAKLPVVDIMNLVSEESSNPRMKSSGDIEYVGEYMAQSIPATGTNLLEHRLHGTFEVTAVPAPLHIQEVEDKSKLHINGHGSPDLLQTQLDKYAKEFTSPVDLDCDLEDMKEQLVDHFTNVLKDEDLSPMTEEETLSGLDDVDSKPMDVRTTAGEPFARLGKSQGKKKNSFLKMENDPDTGRKLFTIDDSTSHGKYLKEAIDLKEQLAKKRIRTLSLWKNCLKDETRPLEKAKIGKTRLFTAAPMDTVYLGRKYFGKFKEAWQKHRFELFHAVGISPVSPDWTVLMTNLKAKGQDFNDADFSAYDGNLRADFMRIAGEIVSRTIANVYSNVNSCILETIWEEFVETFHVGYSTVQICKHGNPSGNPMTTVVNCIVNLLYHWYAYRRITEKTSLYHFNTEVGFTCFGDDVVFCTNEKISGYTFDAVAKIMAELGQDYTTAQKDSSSSVAKTFDEITFLKRRFRQEGSLYLAPLDTESIEQQFNYTYIGENDLISIGTQLTEAAIEASLHGSKYYNEFSQKLNKSIACDSALRMYMPSMMTYTDARASVIKRVHGIATTTY